MKREVHRGFRYSLNGIDILDAIIGDILDLPDWMCRGLERDGFCGNPSSKADQQQINDLTKKADKTADKLQDAIDKAAAATGVKPIDPKPEPKAPTIPPGWRTMKLQDLLKLAADVGGHPVKDVAEAQRVIEAAAAARK